MTGSYDVQRTIAVCQTAHYPNDLHYNLKKVMAWMKKAAESGADIALFGELFLTETNKSTDLHKPDPILNSTGGSTTRLIQEASKELGIAVVYGYSEVDEGKFYNSLKFLNKKGEELANYRKIHLWPNEELNSPGSNVTVVDWDGLRVGLSIGTDICVPGFIGTMVANGGAQLVLNANAAKNDKYPELMAGARAVENGCYFAYVDMTGDSHSGMSRVYEPQGDCVTAAETNEEVLLTASMPLYAKEAQHAYSGLQRPELYKKVIGYDTEVPWRRDTAESVQYFFRNRAQYYDRQMEGVYNGPRISAAALASFVSDKEKKVLDVAAGTGLIGEALFGEGFRNLIALDRSPAMLGCLAQKGIYNGAIQGDFEEEAKKIGDGAFHACICVGAFLTGGFLDPTIAATEMMRMAEIGGFVLLLWNETELEESECVETRENLDIVLDTLVQSGACEVAEMKRVPEYLEECVGKLVVLKKIG